MKRIEFLDGLRGVAIIMVICFHAFSKWPSIVPYGNTYGDFPLFKYGNLGVQLFFLISGFVILMSLEKHKNFFQFFYKRWLRLFPAMLIATILIYPTAHFFYERPAGMPTTSSIIPGLFFIEPNWIEDLTGIKINPLEAAFWSLYIEFKFYFIFGVSYFLFGDKKAILAILSFYVLFIIGSFFSIGFLLSLSSTLSLIQFGWFASGSLAYLYFVSKENRYLYLSVLTGFSETYQFRHDLQSWLFSIFILLLFFVPIYFQKARSLLSNSVLLFLGFVSYPLYLIHENTMISLICKVSKIIDIPSILLPLVPIAILIFIAFIITKILEPFVRKMIIQISTSANSGFKILRFKRLI